jgi:hypothetical protein
MFAPPQPLVEVRLDERGKVHYRGRDLAAGVHPPAGSYMSMPIDDFAHWKNAGKRSPSNKVTDPNSGQNYIYEGGKFYPLNGKVRSPASIDVTHGAFSHLALENQLHGGTLINRQRLDRTAGALQEFDVGPYERRVDFPGALGIPGRSHKPLPKAKKAWAANNDHIPSGQSLHQRNPGDGGAAYKQGMTIAITADSHRKFSPTYGGRQTTHDVDFNAFGAPQPSMRRVVHDRKRPARAFHRDTELMLHSTGAQPGYVGPRRLRQLGGYRTLYRMNTRMNAAFGPGRGVDPNEPAMTIAPSPVHAGRFEYRPSPVPGATQGQLIAHDFRQRLLGEGFAKP